MSATFPSLNITGLPLASLTKTRLIERGFRETNDLHGVDAAELAFLTGLPQAEVDNVLRGTAIKLAWIRYRNKVLQANHFRCRWCTYSARPQHLPFTSPTPDHPIPQRQR